MNNRYTHTGKKVQSFALMLGLSFCGAVKGSGFEFIYSAVYGGLNRFAGEADTAVTLVRNADGRLPVILDYALGFYSFQYDSSGRRIVEQQQGNTTHLIYNNELLPLAEFTADETRYRFPGNGYTIDVGQTLFPVNDRLGSVRSLVRQGVTQAQFDYSITGRPQEVSNCRDGCAARIYPYRFQGHRYLAFANGQSGIHDFSGRFYDHNSGKFTHTDLARQSYSPYSAMGDDWINYIDSDGQMFGWFTSLFSDCPFCKDYGVLPSDPSQISLIGYRHADADFTAGVNLARELVDEALSEGRKIIFDWELVSQNGNKAITNSYYSSVETMQNESIEDARLLYSRGFLDSTGLSNADMQKTIERLNFLYDYRDEISNQKIDFSFVGEYDFKDFFSDLQNTGKSVMATGNIDYIVLAGRRHVLALTERSAAVSSETEKIPFKAFNIHDRVQSAFPDSATSYLPQSYATVEKSDYLSFTKGTLTEKRVGGCLGGCGVKRREFIKGERLSGVDEMQLYLRNKVADKNFSTQDSGDHIILHINDGLEKRRSLPNNTEEFLE